MTEILGRFCSQRILAIRASNPKNLCGKYDHHSCLWPYFNILVLLLTRKSCALIHLRDFSDSSIGALIDVFKIVNLLHNPTQNQ